MGQRGAVTSPPWVHVPFAWEGTESGSLRPPNPFVPFHQHQGFESPEASWTRLRVSGKKQIQ